MQTKTKNINSLSLSIALTFFLTFIHYQPLHAKDMVFVNPGFKFGYTFGEKGGFTFGAEISITKWTYNGQIYGIVFSADHCKKSNRFKYHIGAEYNLIEIGPTLTIENGKTDYGMGITPYYGVFLIPFYTYTLRFNNHDLHELGTFLKFHMLVRGRGFSFG